VPSVAVPVTISSSPPSAEALGKVRLPAPILVSPGPHPFPALVVRSVLGMFASD
jgi:hypothetical protein